MVYRSRVNRFSILHALTTSGGRPLPCSLCTITVTLRLFNLFTEVTMILAISVPTLSHKSCGLFNQLNLLNVKRTQSGLLAVAAGKNWNDRFMSSRSPRTLRCPSRQVDGSYVTIISDHTEGKPRLPQTKPIRLLTGTYASFKTSHSWRPTAVQPIVYNIGNTSYFPSSITL